MRSDRLRGSVLDPEVFISVHQFHQSVMVSVATGGGTGEAVPMLIRRREGPSMGDRAGPYGRVRTDGFTFWGVRGGEVDVVG